MLRERTHIIDWPISMQRDWVGYQERNNRNTQQDTNHLHPRCHIGYKLSNLKVIPKNTYT